MARLSGILLHPTSLPSRYGVGDLGDQAIAFCDWLQAGAQRVWQMLPLGPVGAGNSPYMSFSAIAGEPLLISPDRLVEAGWLPAAALEQGPDFNPHRVDFAAVRAYKDRLFVQAWAGFQVHATAEQRTAFEQFCTEQADWLEDFALFMTLKAEFGQIVWNRWDVGFAQRDPAVLAAARQTLAEPIALQRFLQFVFFEQWQQLKTAANERGVQLVGDVPIYVSFDSADVWANRELFALDPDTLDPAQMAGVPPDYFSATGQLWGNPVYDWETNAQTGYRWWIKRFRHLFTMVDWVRIDHFRGFESFWAVPQGEETAINGDWVPGPGAAFFEAVQGALGKLPVIAEDLGIITPEVEALRDRFQFPGMKILQFAFDSGSGNPYLPHNYRSPNYVVYTGTHDNDTTVGWFNGRSPEEQQRVIRYAGYAGPDGIQWDLTRMAMASVADWAIVPLQDCLGFGSDCRMNVPGQADGNWEWRCLEGSFAPWMADRLRELVDLYGRWG